MAGLSGKIFSLSGHVGGARTPHPHVVAIELSDRCWLLPAYTTGGHEIEQYKQAVFPALGLRPEQAFVEMDNAEHVRFYDGRPAHRATWVVERVNRWTKVELGHHQPVGEMGDARLLNVTAAWVALIDARPELFPPHLRHRVNRLADELRSRSGTP